MKVFHDILDPNIILMYSNISLLFGNPLMEKVKETDENYIFAAEFSATHDDVLSRNLRKKKKQFVLLCTVPKEKQTKNLCFLQDLPWITIQTRTIITEDQKIKFQSQQKKVANNIPFSKTNMALARNYLLIEKQMSEFSINLLSTELSKKNFTFLYLTSIKNITDFPISIENLLLSFHSLISIKKDIT